MTILITIVIPTIAGTIIGLTVLFIFAVGIDRRREKRLEVLNEESWEVLQTARRVHDEMASALESMFTVARQANQPGSVDALPGSEVERFRG